MLNIVAVLRKSGSTYDESWVQKLRRGIERNLAIPYKFICLTNLSSIEGVETKPLTESFPHWWSKIELFKPNQFEGKVLYFDIDSMICGNFDQIASIDSDDLIMLRDSPAFPNLFNSGLMYWDASNPVYQNIFFEFKKDMFKTMITYSGKGGVGKFGDQSLIVDVLEPFINLKIKKWQDIFPSHWFIPFSYLDKMNPDIENGTYNKDIRFNYCLGYPKFLNRPDLPIVQQNWK